MAQRHAGLRIHEVPVDGVDDPDSSIDVVATDVADLRDVTRLLGGLTSGRTPLDEICTGARSAPLPRPVVA